jgi:hypothetical protein
LKVKEKKIIREINDYVNKIKNINDNNPVDGAPAPAVGPAVGPAFGSVGPAFVPPSGGPAFGSVAPPFNGLLDISLYCILYNKLY